MNLHLVAVAHLQVDLLAAVAVVELRHVNEPFDPSSSSTNAPKLVMRVTFPSIVSPT